MVVTPFVSASARLIPRHVMWLGPGSGFRMPPKISRNIDLRMVTGRKAKVKERI